MDTIQDLASFRNSGIVMAFTGLAAKFFVTWKRTFINRYNDRECYPGDCCWCCLLVQQDSMWTNAL